MSRLILVFCMLLASGLAFSQDDLMAMLEEDSDSKETVIATFKGTRLVHGHSVKLRSKGELDFLIAHRFGLINAGAYSFFGLDDAQMRIGLDYALTDRLMLGIGRSSVDKTYDGFLKFGLVQQSRGAGSFPFSVVLVGGVASKTSPQAKFNPDISTSDRFSYSYSALIARKFSPSFSLQLMPVFIHKNRVMAPEVNNTMALGTGMRLLVTPSVSLNLEYYQRLNPPSGIETHNSLAFGVDIETGGHVFQLHLSNSRGMIDRSFITETTGDISDGDLHFGFNISRTFNLSRKR